MAGWARARARRRANALLVAGGAMLGGCAKDVSSPTPEPASTRTVSVTYCDELAPTWVAFQDGGGNWSRVPPVANGGTTTFRYEFTTDRGAIATVTPILDGALTQLRVLYGRPAELESEGDTLRVDCGAIGSKTLRATIAGLESNEKALVSTGNFMRVSVFPTSPALTLVGVPDGPQDLLASRSTETSDGGVPAAFILRRDVNVPDGSELPIFDFTSSEGFLFAAANVTIEGAGADGVLTLTELHTRNSRMVLPFFLEQTTPATRRYFALPERVLEPGDLQLLHLSTSGPSRTNRTADVYFRSPVDRTLALGAPMEMPTLSAEEGGPSLRVRTRFPMQSEYDRSASIVFDQASTTAVVAISMTAAYGRQSGAGYDLVVPDLSQVPGFDPEWALRPGVAFQWSATLTGGTVPLGRNTPPFDGATQRAAFLRDTITLPVGFAVGRR